MYSTFTTQPIGNWQLIGAKMAEVWWQQAFLILLLFQAATHAFAR